MQRIDPLASPEPADADALVPGRPRGRPEILRFFAGLELISPGLVDVAAWKCARGRADS